MLGNCATGRVRMVSAPTITMTMEITMATMGRLMKNFDTGLSVLRSRAERPGVHGHARTHLLYALGHHAFAPLQSVRNDPLGAHTVSDCDRSDAHFVFA